MIELETFTSNNRRKRSTLHLDCIHEMFLIIECCTIICFLFSSIHFCSQAVRFIFTYNSIRCAIGEKCVVSISRQNRKSMSITDNHLQHSFFSFHFILTKTIPHYIYAIFPRYSQQCGIIPVSIDQYHKHAKFENMDLLRVLLTSIKIFILVSDFFLE